MSARVLDGQLDLAGAPALTEAERREWWFAGVLSFLASQRPGRVLSASELREQLPEPPHPNMWGVAFRRAAQDGLITFHGFIESDTPSRRGGIQRLWVRT